MHRGVELIVVEPLRGFNHRPLELLEGHRGVAVGVQPLHRLPHLDLIAAWDERDREFGELVAVELAGVVLVDAFEHHLQFFKPVRLGKLDRGEHAPDTGHERLLVHVLHDLEHRGDVLVLVNLPVPVFVHPCELRPRLFHAFPGIDLPTYKHELVKVQRAVAVAVQCIERVTELLRAVHLVEPAAEVLSLRRSLRREPRLRFPLLRHRLGIFSEEIAQKLQRPYGSPVRRDVPVLVPVLPRRHTEPLGLDRVDELVQAFLHERHHLGFEVLSVVFAVVVESRIGHLLVGPREQVLDSVFKLWR